MKKEDKRLNILILDAGGRGSAIARACMASPLHNMVYVLPGNGETRIMCENIDLPMPKSEAAFKELAKHVRQKRIDLIIPGSEEPLVAGIVDYFQKQNDIKVMICGPNQMAAQLEGSKAFSKAFMKKAGIPTADFVIASRGIPGSMIAAQDFIAKHWGKVAIKADGLCAGKGVTVHDDKDEALRSLNEMIGGKFKEQSAKVVVEERLYGKEISLFVAMFGKDKKHLILPSAKDFKKLYNNDEGPNTGGMGAISPAPGQDTATLARLETYISRVKKSLPTDYRGFLYFGCIKTDSELHVLEFNCRLGDPEAQTILPRMECDFVVLCQQMASGSLFLNYHEKSESAVTLVMASEGYGLTGPLSKGQSIIGIELAKKNFDVIVRHAGTKFFEGKLNVDGGRVLSLTALRDNVEEAAQAALAAAKYIEFDGKYFRTDIGTKAEVTESVNAE